MPLGLSYGADAFALAFTVALVLVACCVVPSWLLPHGKAPATTDEHESATVRG